MKKVLGWVVTVIVILIASVVGKMIGKAGFEAVSTTVSSPKNPYPESSPLHQPFKNFMDKMLTAPEFKAYLKTVKDSEQAFQMGLSLSKNGMKKLDETSLEKRMHTLSLAFDFMDVSACAVMVRGSSVNPRQITESLTATLGQLDPQYINDWFDLSYNAIIAQLRSYPEPVVQEAAVESAMNSLIQRLPPSDGVRLLAVLTNLQSANDRDTCWAGKTLYKTALQLNQPNRSVLARAFTSE